MAPLKCCVSGCESTRDTERLFCIPINEHLRKLWMSMLVPVNSHLLGLTEYQLRAKRVCQKHFDQTQFDQQGLRIRYSYPCLFTEKEIFHGVPLSSEGEVILQEHLYSLPSTSEAAVSQKSEDGGLAIPRKPLMDISQNVNIVSTPYELPQPSISKGEVILQEHLYSLPSTSEAAVSQKSEDGDGLLLEHQHAIPSVTTQATTSKNGGLAIPRKPFMDINQNVDIVSTPYELPQPSTSKGSCTDISQKSNVDPKKSHGPKEPTSQGNSSVKQFKAKSRRFIKQTTKIATDSLGQTNTERLQNAQKHISQDLIENFEKLHRKAKAFLLMQLRLVRKNKMARRFNLQDKLFALALLKQSPKGYKLLENIFALPTKRTLTRLSKEITFECGINESTFRHIKNNIKNWEENKKLCSLVLDEVALTPNLIYNENKDLINGFVDIAGERKQKFADHALVFMIRGICSSWRQSIAYYFCAGTVSAPELKNILNDIVRRLSKAGLKPIALVCDQGSTFRSCLKDLKNRTNLLQTPHERRNDDTVHVAGHDLFIFYDPPHLLKGIRNNFLDKDILFEGKKASWDDILNVYDLDIKAGHTRALPKLTADHVDPKKIRKMKVKTAAQVLSARTAAMLNYTHAIYERLKMPKETMGTTAAVVLFFDELFDSVNGSPGQVKRGKLRSAVKNNSVHQQFWRSAIQKLKKH